MAGLVPAIHAVPRDGGYDPLPIAAHDEHCRRRHGVVGRDNPRVKPGDGHDDAGPSCSLPEIPSDVRPMSRLTQSRGKSSGRGC